MYQPVPAVEDIRAGVYTVIMGKPEEYIIFSKRVVYKTALLLYDGCGKRFPENIFRQRDILNLNR